MTAMSPLNLASEVVSSKEAVMGFLDIGAGEIVLILVVALIIWGPGKISEIARMMGKVMYNLKKATFDLTTVVTKEMDKEGKDSPSKSKESSGGKTKEPSDTGEARLQQKEGQSKGT